MKRRLMRFKLEDGNLYLIEEEVPALSLEAFRDLLKAGYRGLAISRTPREEFQKAAEGDYDFVWLAEKGKQKSIPPRFERIELCLEDLPRRSAVYLDRLDYLLVKNGFQQTLFFVQRLRELAYLTGNIIMLSIDPYTLSDRSELRLLEKEAMEVDPRSVVGLPEHMLEILRFVYRQNNFGVKPNYSAIRQQIGISKPTASKRMKYLIATGYLTEVARGRTKVTELTQKGRNLFYP